MVYRIQNTNFFNHPIEHDESIEQENNVREMQSSTEEKVQLPKAKSLCIGKITDGIIRESSAALRELGDMVSVAEIDKMLSNVKRDRFTIAVVGEFNRGKSSFINRFLECDAIPVGNLPTTAVMTRIRNHRNSVLAVFNSHNKKIFEHPLSMSAWDGFVANNFEGDDFEGTALVGVPCKWLAQMNVELIDTPGAGDLNEKRMKVLSDALLGCDGVIIAIDANRALSLSEKTFIEERLLARKLPFMMIIVTKLDQVRANERATILQYIKSRLQSWKMDIPVFVPDDIDIPGEKYFDIVGMEKVKHEMESWIASPDKTDLVEKWLLGRTTDILNNSLAFFQESLHILEANSEENRKKMIDEKMQLLSEAELVWGDLKLKMHQKCSDCYKLLLSKIDGYSEAITERLQYEVRHTNAPGQWWKDDFPYRIKIELTNLSVNIDRIVSQQIQEDVNWYRNSLERSFRSTILYQKTTIAEKEMFGDFKVGDEIEFDDLDKKRNSVRIGAAVLSISGVVLFSAIGFLPIIATMGIGTGSAIISEHFFKRKIEEQREIVQKEIARCVPIFIQNSLTGSEKRLETVYEDIITEAENSERAWVQIQKNAILQSGAEDKDIIDKKTRLSAAVSMIEEKISTIDGLV